MSTTLSKRARGHEKARKKRSRNTRPRPLAEVRTHVHDSAMRVKALGRSMRRPDLIAIGSMLEIVRGAILLDPPRSPDDPERPIDLAVQIASLVDCLYAHGSRIGVRKRVREILETAIASPDLEIVEQMRQAVGARRAARQSTEKPAPVGRGWLAALVAEAEAAPPSPPEEP